MIDCSLEQPAGHVTNSHPRNPTVWLVVKWMSQVVGVTRGIRAMVRLDVSAFREHFLTESDALRANNVPQTLSRPESVQLEAPLIQRYACVMPGITATASPVLHAEHVIQMLQRSERVLKEV